MDVHERRGVPWQLIAGVALTILLVTLATLQYRWLGEVGEAERARMRASLQTRAADFTQAFDRELTQIYVAFHGEPGVSEEDPARAIAVELARAQASLTVPGLIRDVFLLEAQGPRAGRLQRLDPITAALEPVDWPPPLAAWRARAAHGVLPADVAGVLPIVMADAVDASAPALIIPMPFVKRIDSGPGRFAVVPDPAATPRAIVVWLDAERLRQQLLEPLAAKYFGTGDQSEYVVSVLQRDNPATVVYSSANGGVLDEHAEVSTGMFDLRMNEMARLTGPLPPAGGSAKPATDRVAVTIVRRSSNAGDAARVLMTGGPGQGAWVVRAGYRGGSLETIVARSRRRNLAISASVLGLLAAALVLVVAAAQRQRRLARQQMEFVAAVSHELRTPLAVICSAGENLSDGVVGDSAQVRTYGTLIETEGRRLGDMVERVLLFAGIGSGVRVPVRADVDLTRVVADAVRGVDADARDRGVTVVLNAVGAVPSLIGDADGLRSAVQNIVGNAVKYSPSGSTVEVTIELIDGSLVRIRVADRGIGIDAADLPHIFQPFYRGRRAVEAQVRGAGIGLSVVLHVVRSHGGDVEFDSRVGEGTTVTVVLPVSNRGGDRERVVRFKGQRTRAAS